MCICYGKVYNTAYRTIAYRLNSFKTKCHILKFIFASQCICQSYIGADLHGGICPMCISTFHKLET